MAMDSDLHKEALEKYEEARSHWGEIYDQIEEDCTFALNIDNCQWEDGREYEKTKLKLAINKCESEIDAIVNEMRASKPAINTSPVDDKADVRTSEVLDDLIRNIEYVSDASTAYDTSAFAQVAGGLGFFRVTTEWVPGTFDQEPRIKAIQDFRSVLMDPLSSELDGSDQAYSFVTDKTLSKDDFSRKYPDAEHVSFDKMKSGWHDGKHVTIAEYFYKDTSYEKLYLVSMNGQLDVLRHSERADLEGRIGYGIDNLGDAPDPMDGIIRIVDERKEEVNLVRWCKLNGNEILEKTDWLSQYIPIIPVYGKLVFNKGERHVSGLIKNLRDPQKLLNYWESSHTEIIALQPKSPYVGYDETVEDYREEWMDANNKAYPVLRVKPVVVQGQLLPPPMRQPPPQPSPAMQSQSMMALQHIKSVTGKVYDEGQKTLGSESGKALLAKERKADVSSFHYIDNQSKSIRHAGKILVDLIPKLYTKAKVLRVTGEDGEERQVPVNQRTQITEKGKTFEGIYDLRVGKYDVSVNVGPSYSSRRQEAAESMIAMTQAVPQLMSVAGDLIVKNMDWPGAQELADRLKKMLPPNLADDEKTPEQVALMQATQAIEVLKAKLAEQQKALEDKSRSEDMKHQIDLMKVQNDQRETEIKAFEAQIKAMEAEAKAKEQIPAEAFAQVINSIMEINAGLEDTQNALALILDDEQDSGDGMGERNGL